MTGFPNKIKPIHHICRNCCLLLGFGILISFPMIPGAQTSLAVSGKTLTIQKDTRGFARGRISLRSFLYVLPDPGGNLTIEEAASDAFLDEYRPGFNHRQILAEYDCVWIRLTLSSKLAEDLDWLVNISAAKIDLYLADTTGGFQQLSSGVFLPIRERAFTSSLVPAFPLHIRGNESQTIYWRVQRGIIQYTDRLVGLDQTLMSPTYFYQYDERFASIVSGYAGLILAVIIYHLVIFFYNRESSYLHFALYGFVSVITATVGTGFAQEWYFPDAWLPHHFTIMWTGLALQFAFLTQFTRVYLKSKQLQPIADRLLVVYTALLIAVGTSLIAFFYPMGYYKSGFMVLRINQLMVIVYMILLLVVGLLSLLKGYRPARIYMIASLVFFISMVLLFLTVLDILPPVELLVYPIYGRAAQVLLFSIGLAQLFKNLQDQKLAAETRQRLAQEKVTKRLLQVDKLKDQFLANTSHELKTPLNGMIGLAESLKDGIAGELPSKAVENLELITVSGRRLSTLVNDILDFSKIAQHELELNLRPQDVKSIVNVVLNLSRPLLGNKTVALQNKIPDGMPFVLADENRLQQILYNLVGNAIKFTEKGTIIVGAEMEEDFLVVSVKDTGIGIPEDKLDAIFEYFEQADGSIAREYGGTGIGLNIAQSLVTLHGGKLNVASKLGEGSSFTFTLRIAKEEPIAGKETYAAEIVPVHSHPTPVPAIDDRTIPQYGQSQLASILIVDDDPINLRVLENHLELAGYRVTKASNGNEALEIIRTSPKFDLIILDIMMPKVTGYQVCHQLRSIYLPSELPIIMLTAKNQVSDLVRGFDTGANDYLAKPFSKDELLSRIKTHLNLHLINQATGKFVPHSFLRSIGRASITEVQWGDQAQKEVTVFFSDIRGYTTLSEKMTPNDNFKFINAYVRRMGPAIQKFDGFVHQYLGDGIMAIFPNLAEKALKSAIEMQRTLRIYNEERSLKGRDPIRVGMGMHTGPLIMGIIGDESRNEAATISDIVNTASRMEGLTKYYGASILLSKNSYDTIENHNDFHFRYLGKVQVKGKTQPIAVYECFDGDAPEIMVRKKDTLDQFNTGLDHYFNKRFPEATVVLQDILRANPEDQVARFFFTKAGYYISNGIDEEWDGTETMLVK